MANKIRYGLRNVKYALYNSEGQAYGSPVSWPGAVSLSLTVEGGDPVDFYADDGVYYTVGGSNGGYSGDLEMAYIPDTIRVDLLGERADAGTGVQYEVISGEAAEFALICEIQGDSGPVGFVFYGCKASRPEMTMNTKGESLSVDTSTLSVRIAGHDFTMSGKSEHVIQGHIEKTNSNTSEFNAFFNAVSVPTAGGDLSA